jgi:hypothetical protein
VKALPVVPAQALAVSPAQAPKPSGELALPIPKPSEATQPADSAPPLDILPPPLPDGQSGTPPSPGKQIPTVRFPGVPVEPNTPRTQTTTVAKQNTAPAEVPADRVVDLTQRLATALAQNKELLAKIRELEAAGVKREQALAEALREVETASAEVAKTRATILALRTEVTALQKTVQQMEKDDVEILRMVIKALEKQLPPPATRDEP